MAEKFEENARVVLNPGIQRWFFIAHHIFICAKIYISLSTFQSIIHHFNVRLL